MYFSFLSPTEFFATLSRQSTVNGRHSEFMFPTDCTDFSDFFSFFFSIRCFLAPLKKTLYGLHRFLLAALVAIFRQNDRRTFFLFLTYALICRWHIAAKKDRLVTTCGRADTRAECPYYNFANFQLVTCNL